MLTSITPEFLRKLAPRVSGVKARQQAEIISLIPTAIHEAGPVAELNTPLRMAHFFAQIAHESDGFCAVEEYASGAAYEWRRDLGNTQPGDGRRYKGRGLIQVTGRKNYTDFTAWGKASQSIIGNMPDFVAQPELLALFPGPLLSASWYWQTHSLNKYADKDDLAAVSNIINCGRVSCRVNGGPSRAQYLARAKELLGIGGSGIAGAPRALRMGDRGDYVKRAQKALAAAGFYQGQADGIYGQRTAAATQAFQRSVKLKSDGILGAATADKLFATAPMTIADMQAGLSA